MSTDAIPMLDLGAQHAPIAAELTAAIARLLASSRFVLGPEVEAFEASVARYSGSAYGVGVSSGTDALLVALMALGVGAGDDVITTPYTFVATATSIARLGARPVLVDIEPRAFALDVERAAAAITERTRVIVPVHLFGQMADVRTLAEETRARGVAIVEDAAQAIGAEQNGARAGSVGTLGAFSFFPSKNLGALGDGGMVVTNDRALEERVRLLRSHGQRERHVAVAIGGNFRLDALQAAVLAVKLPHLDRWIAARRANAASYESMFRASGLAVCEGPLVPGAELALPAILSGRTHTFNQYVIRVACRDGLRDSLAAVGIASEIYYPTPVHLQPAFASLGYRAGDFPESERAARETLAVPIFPELGEARIARVVTAVVDFLRRRGRS